MHEHIPVLIYQLMCLILDTSFLSGWLLGIPCSGVSIISSNSGIEDIGLVVWYLSEILV